MKNDRYDEDMRILLLDGYKKDEAVRALERGTTVYDGDDFSANLESYLEEWQFDDEDAEKIREMVNSRGDTWATDWSVVDDSGKLYYICHVL